MSSRLGTAQRLTPRRLLAAVALAAVVGLGMSVSVPTGSASAATAPVSSSSTADPGSIAASQEGVVNRDFYVTAADIARLVNGSISSYALAGRVCQANHSGRACVVSVSYALRAARG